MVESAYWTPDVDGERRANILNNLVRLIPTAPTGELRSRFACSLAVLMLGLYRGSVHFKPSSSYKYTELEAGRARKPPLRLVEYYLKNPNNVVRDERALFLFALTSLMQHYEHCDFDDQGQASMKIVAEQLSTLDNLGKPRPITLPKETGLKFDIRRFFVETLVRFLKQARTPIRSQTTDKIFVSLLKSVKNKRQIWIDHGSLIILPIIQILAHTDSIELKSECLRTIIANWELGPSLLYSRILFSYDVPYKLVKLINDARVQNSEQQPVKVLRSIMPGFFENLAKQVETKNQPNLTTNHADREMLASFLEELLRHNLLETFVREALGLAIDIKPRTNPTQNDQAAKIGRRLGLSRPVSLYDETCEYLEGALAEPSGVPKVNGLLLRELFELRSRSIVYKSLLKTNTHRCLLHTSRD